MYSLLYLFVTPRTMEIGKSPHESRGQCTLPLYIMYNLAYVAACSLFGPCGCVLVFGVAPVWQHAEHFVRIL